MGEERDVRGTYWCFWVAVVCAVDMVRQYWTAASERKEKMVFHLDARQSRFGPAHLDHRASDSRR